ncbi:nucleoside diphosphate kinase regulator [Amycolatopsis antarctica]|uniref:Nucleoside diphosphate kinase regulator n=1 Tax=Amycolatopsis antarctica TaxID=1854586 RepID=A0A263D0A7_9PSEU|nr:GreA/GreB family elongation factor [Amycolatopsis antarctica]OZM71870.1 nucleoside diphosphate kinase regulator [Amycolatopsis antarctica]
MTSTSGLSESARTRLEQELAQVQQQRDALAPRLSEESMGDAADQADVLERAENAAWLDRRATEISDLLTGKAPSVGQDGLAPGTVVELRYDDGDTEKLRVIAIAEEAEDGVPTVTADSPAGKAIAGRSAGDTVTYRTPGGEVSAEIVSLTPPS